MGDKDIRQKFTPLDLQIADGVGRNSGLTVEEVLISAKLGTKTEQLVEAKRGDRQKQISTKGG
jgi:hypothetical protein